MSLDANIELSVVMPVYNEEGSIEKAIYEVQEHILNKVPSNLIVVNDGSKDRTLEIVEKICAGNQQIKVINQTNRGHGGALLTGISATTSEYIFLIDSDRQIPLSAFEDLWKQAKTHDLVMGVRKNRQDPPTRLILTKLVRQSIRLFFGVEANDANVPFKILNRNLWTAATKYIPDDSLTPSLLLCVFALCKKYRVHEVEVPHRERMAGQSTIRHFKLLKFCAKAFSQLMEFRRRLAA
ncbi:MAG: glycosyltransferase family 2 protein [Candidatus Obscuribacterales bacterium]|nr:glycosyltransferase family 2 protein [Candidatus Obscuribacterales bacterium]